MTKNTGMTLAKIKADFALDWRGYHGVRHWARVRRNGREIAQHVPGIDLQVLDWFAVLHDAWRLDEDQDPNHGTRAYAALRLVHRNCLGLTQWQWRELMLAIAWHSAGRTNPETVTIAACWNADRLDLGRVGITPAQRFLCPEALPPRHIWLAMHHRAVQERAYQQQRKKLP